jgi:hypothetical protein
VFRHLTAMDNPNTPIQPREASDVNDHGKFDPLTGFRRFFGEITREGLGSSPGCDSLPVAPIGPRKESKMDTSAEVSSQLNLEI